MKVTTTLANKASELTDLPSNSITALLKAYDFSKLVKVSGRCLAWAEIQEWIQDRIADRDAV